MPSIGVRMHARRWPAPGRPVLVLVAGLGVSSRYWIPLARRLAGRFDVVAPDLPGFGRTRRPPDVPWPGGPNAPEQASQLLAWMDARGIARATLCGHSNGCQVAADVAALRPACAERLILLAPTYELGKRALLHQVPRLLAAAAFETPSLFLTLAVDYASAGPARALQQAYRMLHYPLEKVLALVTAPTMVLYGELDPLAPRRWATYLASRVRQSVTVEVERVGHAVHYSAAVATAAAIERFVLGGLDAAPPSAAGAVLSPTHDPRRDAHARLKPLSLAAHATLDAVVAAAAAAAALLPASAGLGRGGRRTLAAAAAISVAANLLTDRGRRAPGRVLPPLAHANVDLALGAALVAASATALRGAPTAARVATAALGLYHLATVALTAKPTGPTRLIAPAAPPPAAESPDQRS